MPRPLKRIGDGEVVNCRDTFSGPRNAEESKAPAPKFNGRTFEHVTSNKPGPQSGIVARIKAALETILKWAAMTFAGRITLAPPQYQKLQDKNDSMPSLGEAADAPQAADDAKARLEEAILNCLTSGNDRELEQTLRKLGLREEHVCTVAQRLREARASEDPTKLDTYIRKLLKELEASEAGDPRGDDAAEAGDIKSRFPKGTKELYEFLDELTNSDGDDDATDRQLDALITEIDAELEKMGPTLTPGPTRQTAEVVFADRLPPQRAESVVPNAVGSDALPLPVPLRDDLVSNLARTRNDVKNDAEIERSAKKKVLDQINDANLLDTPDSVKLFRKLKDEEKYAFSLAELEGILNLIDKKREDNSHYVSDSMKSFDTSTAALGVDGQHEEGTGDLDDSSKDPATSLARKFATLDSPAKAAFIERLKEVAGSGPSQHGSDPD